jgi:hypothetical protein
MKYPQLVPDWVCTTPITITIDGEGLDEDGAPNSLTNITTVCNWQDGGEAVLTGDQKIIDIKGRAYFNGDIAPSLSNITSGEAVIFGEKREILRGYKRRNPDGTVNHTEIQFK